MIDVEKYDEIIRECCALGMLKNNDYSSDGLLAFGSKGLVVRLYDKATRLKNLVWVNKISDINDEKIEDTAKDMINYAVYLIMSERGTLK